MTLIAANVALPAPPGVRRLDVETTAELEQAARQEFAAAHVLLMAAAPADFRPAHAADEKLTRDGSLDLSLQPTEDILAGLATTRTADQTIVGFAAEHGGEATARARAKLSRKGADLIVLNDVSDPSIGFESPDNAVTLISSNQEPFVPQAPKQEIAAQILDAVEALRAGRGSPRPADTQAGA